MALSTAEVEYISTSDVSQGNPVRSSRISINKSLVLSFVHLILWRALTSIAQFVLVKCALVRERPD